MSYSRILSKRKIPSGISGDNMSWTGYLWEPRPLRFFHHHPIHLFSGVDVRFRSMFQLLMMCSHSGPLTKLENVQIVSERFHYSAINLAASWGSSPTRHENIACSKNAYADFYHSLYSLPNPSQLTTARRAHFYQKPFRSSLSSLTFFDRKSFGTNFFFAVNISLSCLR